MKHFARETSETHFPDLDRDTRAIAGFGVFARNRPCFEIKVGGVGNHGISIGVYFFDPDGNEIEVFYELPRDQWPTEGQLFAGKFPLGSLEEVPAGDGD